MKGETIRVLKGQEKMLFIIVRATTGGSYQMSASPAPKLSDSRASAFLKYLQVYPNLGCVHNLILI